MAERDWRTHLAAATSNSCTKDNVARTQNAVKKLQQRTSELALCAIAQDPPAVDAGIAARADRARSAVQQLAEADAALVDGSLCGRRDGPHTEEAVDHAVVAAHVGGSASGA